VPFRVRFDQDPLEERLARLGTRTVSERRDARSDGATVGTNACGFNTARCLEPLPRGYPSVTRSMATAILLQFPVTLFVIDPFRRMWCRRGCAE